ncbi:UNVERIFIED_CONTAM: E3 ubiquitin-protein ligase UPL1 [Sesamum radiatum]|uniref:HECT-type E3 ubiquitin transferase n=1 Tax=Sesamum radiatum TaxID=300843 RepID=A0AAW2T2S2_SESRA
MFDAPVLPYDNAPTNLFGDRLGGSVPTQLGDFSVGLESLRGSGRRGLGDGRWTDDGQPQGGGHAAAIAQAVEEQFISQLSNNVPAERLSQNPGLAERQEGDPILAIDNQLALGVDNADVQLNDAQNINNDQQVNELAEVQSQDVNTEVGGQQLGEGQQAMEDVPCEVDNNSMGTRDRNAIDSQLFETASGSVTQDGEPFDRTSDGLGNSCTPYEGDGCDISLEPDSQSSSHAHLVSESDMPDPAPTYAPPTVEDIDPEFLAALPPDIQAEVLAQQRAQRIAQQSEGQPVDMDNASIIATFPAELREEVLLTSSEALLSALPSPLLAEAQMLRDRAMSHYHARSLFGSSQRLNSRGNRLGFDRQTVMDRGVGVTIGRRASSIAENLKLKELEGEPLLDANGLKALIRLLRLAQPLGKGLLQRLLLNLCSHNDTRAILVQLLLDMIKPETLAIAGGLTSMNTQRLYGCQSDVVYGRSQLCDGVPPLVVRRVLDFDLFVPNHSGVASLLFHFEGSNITELAYVNHSEGKDERGHGFAASSCVCCSIQDGQRSFGTYDIFLLLPQSDLHNLCALLGHEGLSDKVYTLAGDVLRKLASVAATHRKFFILELSELAQRFSARLLLGSDTDKDRVDDEEQEEHATMWKLNVALEPLWKELSECIETSAFIEGFFVLCEKLQANSSTLQQDHNNVTAREVKESAGLSVPSSTKGVDSYRRLDGSVTFVRFAEKHRRLLNAFVRQNPGLLEKSLSMLLKAPRLIDFDNKRAYFRSRIRQQHDQHLSGPLRISVRRAYILEDSYNQLRMRPSQDLKGRLNVHFQGEEGIDAGGLTREWYQLLSRVIFDKGALLFTTVGNNATFQPNPNSVYQTEHLSYFRFVGRVVAKALFDGQLLDVYFTRSFYKHILGVKVTYHDIEAVDPDYYKNLKWMLENDVSEIPDLTFSMDADEEKHILYEKTEVTDYELKPGGRNIRVTEETKHEYVDLVADHILTNAIRPQITSFLEGFNELVPRELISIFNDKELELLISGLPEIDLADLKANTEYTGYTAASNVVQWFWEVVEGFNKEDMARFLQFVTGTSKVIHFI